jgi:hypothetical protein
MSAVKAENKFIQVMSQVFGINAVVSAIEPGFEIAEGAVNMQGVGFWGVSFMAITCQRSLGITSPSIGNDHAAGQNAAHEKDPQNHSRKGK